MPRRGRKRRRRGRRKGKRWIEKETAPAHFTPQRRDIQSTKTVNLTLGELEILRLVDLENLTQEEAASMMGISRKTLWSDLHKARKKVADALVNKYPIRVQGGNYIQRR